MRLLTDEALLTLTKPGRYTGGEVNAVLKAITPSTTRFAFCFPDVYEMGMSNLGLQMLYFFINRREDTYCERVFMPWFDMIELLKKEDKPLFAIESGDELKKFDILGFTLQYEMSYTNILAMLDLAKIPLRSKDRDETFPIICAGGPCATNPEPMADFIDFFYIGDGEASLDLILDQYNKHKGNKQKFLESIASINGVYVPQFYDVTYNDNNTIKNHTPNNSNAPGTVNRAFLPKLDFFPETFIIPLTETVQDRAVIEIARGCVHGCRFCQAGFIYRPMRERGVHELINTAEKLIDTTGYSEISLLSLSACDHSNFSELVDQLIELTTEKRVNISLPSTRLDASSLSTLAKTVRKTSLTVAPEAASQRMRNKINKNLTEEEILDGCYRAYITGFDKIKLYFMSGLPHEQEEDTLAIPTLCEKIVDTYYKLSYEERKRPVSVSVSTSCFVPKPFTPFQWAAQVNPSEFITTQKNIKSQIRNKRITYRYHDAKTAQIEGVLARGDRKIGKAIEAAYKQGAVFDGWSEHFYYSTWLNAFEEAGINLDFYNREREADEILPWDFINMGVSKEFLRREWDKSINESISTNCRDGCVGCGLKCKGGETNG